MKALKKNIADLSEESGVSDFTIKKARSDKHITSCRIDSLCKIADALKVNFEDLFVLLNCDSEEKQNDQK